MVADFERVAPAPATRPVGVQTIADFHAELFRHAADHRRRHGNGVRQQGAQEAQSPEMNGAAQAHMGAAVGADEGQVGVVEMKVAGQLLGGGVAAELAVALALWGGEKGDRHQVRPRPARAR